jgi:flagellar hook-associated protein 1 FlgK
VHSLQSVADAMNSTFGTYVTATVVNNKLQITGDPGYSFSFGTDTTGLLAGLGLNTFFSGSSASSLELTEQVALNASLVCAGHVNGGGESNTGDNSVAVDIAGLQTKKVTFYTFFEGTTSQALPDYYNSLLANVGADVDKTSFNLSYHKALAADLDSRQNEVSGVSLDEEMSNLIKFQHSYQAAAKLIMTADQMMQTLLGLKT